MSEKDRIATVESEGCPDGVGIYAEGDWIKLIAYSHQGPCVIEFPGDIAGPLGEALIKIRHGHKPGDDRPIEMGASHKVEHVTLKDGKLSISEGFANGEMQRGMDALDNVVPTTDEQIQQNRNDEQDARDRVGPLPGQHFEGTIKGVINSDGDIVPDAEQS